MQCFKQSRCQQSNILTYITKQFFPRTLITFLKDTSILLRLFRKINNKFEKITSFTSVDSTNQTQEPIPICVHRASRGSAWGICGHEKSAILSALRAPTKAHFPRRSTFWYGSITHIKSPHDHPFARIHQPAPALAKPTIFTTAKTVWGYEIQTTAERVSGLPTAAEKDSVDAAVIAGAMSG